MEAELTEERENHLLGRKEIKLNVKHERSPSREEAKKAISEKFSVDHEKIIIKKIAGKFGSRNFIISADIYKENVKENAKKNTKKREEAPQK